jgi:hypothetical protein
MPKPLEGASITGHDSPLNVAIDSKGGAATTVTLTTRWLVSNRGLPGAPKTASAQDRPCGPISAEMTRTGPSFQSF